MTNKYPASKKLWKVERIAGQLILMIKLNREIIKTYDVDKDLELYFEDKGVI